MTDLANPVYCVSCKKQIQSDATFCPHCGSDQRPPLTRPQPDIVEAEIIAEIMPPQRQAQAPPPAQPQVVYVQQTNKGTNWWPLLLAALLVGPTGCFFIPLLLGAAGAIAVGGIAILNMAIACSGIIAGVVILRKEWFPPHIRKWVAIALILINCAWIMWQMKASSQTTQERARWERQVEEHNRRAGIR